MTALATPFQTRKYKKRKSEHTSGLLRAVSEARTRDPQLGKLMLYQLSYYRVCTAKLGINIEVSKYYEKNFTFFV